MWCLVPACCAPAAFPQLVDVFPAFEGADAHAGRLGRIEGLEQALADELFAHAAAGVGHFHQHAVALARQAHAHLAVARRGFDGVLDQVAQHPFQAFAFGQHFQAGIGQLQRRLGLEGGLQRHGLRQQGAEVLRHGALGGSGTAELLQHQFHFLHRQGHGLHHIALELGIVGMFFRIGGQQRQLRHQVLQVVHHEGGQAVERVELARQHQGIVGLLLGQVGGGLGAGNLQQIQHFPVELDFAARGHQHHEAGQPALQQERHHQPGLGEGQQPGRQRHFRIVQVVGGDFHQPLLAFH